MIRVADYIAQTLAAHGIRHVFMISGGGAMHLNDALGHHPELSYICNHHEQACAIAAEGYFRASGRVAAVNVTSGPGGTNTLTGVLGQWLDSIPAIYISGQVKRETTLWAHPNLGLRQLGDQELPIVGLVRPITKFAAMVHDPANVRQLLEKALFVATEGRPGPVWLDIPLDVQSALIDPNDLQGFVPPASLSNIASRMPQTPMANVVKALMGAKRPVLLAGFGIRLARGEQALLRLAERMRIPVLSTINGFDLIPSDHPLFVGRPGTVGTRCGNFAIQNADLLLSIGSRNNIRQVSYMWKSYARAAYKIIVDADCGELNKPTVVPDLAICADAKAFLDELDLCLEGESLPDWTEWLSWCAERHEKYFGTPSEYKSQEHGINPYPFVETLCDLLPEGAVIVGGNGTAFLAPFQVGRVKRGQRYIWNSGCASMGYDLPAAIGAAFARPGEDIICLAGDGSIQMNIQELQSIVHHRLPIKLFVLSNHGYQSIRQTQDAFFQGNYVACSEGSGVSFPDIVKLAEAYGLPSMRIDTPSSLKEQIEKALRTPGPLVCDVHLTSAYKFNPKLSSERRPDGRMVSKPLEDMAPFLPRDEFASNMLIPHWPES